MASIDKRLQECFNSFDLVDKYAQKNFCVSDLNMNIDNKVQLNNHSMNKYIYNEVENKSKFNESSQVKIKDKDKGKTQKNYPSPRENFVIQQRGYNNIFEGKIIKERTRNITPINVNKNTNKTQFQKFKKINKIQSNNISNPHYHQYNCKIKNSSNFSLSPCISQSSIILAKRKGSPKERILAKKRKTDDFQGIYISPHPNSLYYLNENLIDNDNGNSIRKCVILYEKCKKEQRDKEERLKKIKKYQTEKEEKFTFQPQIKNNSYISHNMQKLSNANNCSNMTNKSTNYTSLPTSNPKKIAQFINNNKDFQNKKVRNLLNLTKRIQNERNSEITFSPKLNTSRIKDDHKNIIRQIPYINDYLDQRRDYLNKSREEPEHPHRLNVSKRRFIIDRNYNTNNLQKKSLKNYRSNSASEVLNEREQLGLRDFYEHSIRLDTSINDTSFIEAVNNITKSKYFK